MSTIPSIQEQETKKKRIIRIINHFTNDKQQMKYTKIIDKLVEVYVVGYKHLEKIQEDVRALSEGETNANSNDNISKLNSMIKDRKALLYEFNIVIHKNIKNIAMIIKNSKHGRGRKYKSRKKRIHYDKSKKSKKKNKKKKKKRY